MVKSVTLFQDLLEKSEKYLVPIGVWPTANNGWKIIFNITVLTVYSLMVLIKNLSYPEKESIENAFTLANGGLVVVIYFVTMAVKKDKFMKFFEFIKSNSKVLMNNEYKELMLAGGIEYRRITSAFIYILFPSVLVRFIQPPIEYVYVELFRPDVIYSLPPSMGIPTFLFGEISTYIIESIVRMIMLITLMGVCTIFIMSMLYICTLYSILAMELKNFRDNNHATINKMIKTHQEILIYTKLMNELFTPYFLLDCILSFINLSILLFSLTVSNANIQNYMMETPLMAVGMSQLFFLLYFGDRLIDATFEISTELYQSEWYDMSISIQKKILIIIMRGQKPQTLNFGGNNVMVASMLLFSEICQRAWGAFNILKTTVQR